MLFDDDMKKRIVGSVLAGLAVVYLSKKLF